VRETETETERQRERENKIQFAISSEKVNGEFSTVFETLMVLNE
jgi:hypothetical protein